MSWCWLALLDQDHPDHVGASGALAAAGVSGRTGRRAGVLAVWPRGRKPVPDAVRMDERLVDSTGSSAWLSLVLIPRGTEPLFDDPAVSEALRTILRFPSYDAVSTLVRDPSHLAGAVTVSHDRRPQRLLDDPFARIHPAQMLHVEAGLFGSVPAPAGPAIQRYSGKPWPASGF